METPFCTRCEEVAPIVLIVTATTPDGVVLDHAMFCRVCAPHVRPDLDGIGIIIGSLDDEAPS